MNSILKLSDLSIGYSCGRNRNVKLAEHINLSLSKGIFVCLLGPNGAGKSTLIRTISGMQKPMEGTILLENENLYHIPSAILAKKLSVVLTERAEVGLLTAYEVVSLGRYPYTNWTGKLLDRDHEVIHNCIRLTGSEVLAGRQFNELSDGERQRIIMARALAQEPKLLILDEITAFLDLPRRVEFMHLLRNLTKTAGCTVILSTHDLDLALSTADSIWLMPKQQSLIVGTPEDLILNGAFESAFSSEGLMFDVDSGRFKMKSGQGYPIHLAGEGVRYNWTKKALERSGFEVSRQEQKIKIKICYVPKTKAYTWDICLKNSLISCRNIQEMLANLTICTTEYK